MRQVVTWTSGRCHKERLGGQKLPHEGENDKHNATDRWNTFDRHFQRLSRTAYGRIATCIFSPLKAYIRDPAKAVPPDLTSDPCQPVSQQKSAILFHKPAREDNVGAPARNTTAVWPLRPQPSNRLHCCPAHQPPRPSLLKPPLDRRGLPPLLLLPPNRFATSSTRLGYRSNPRAGARQHSSQGTIFRPSSACASTHEASHLHRNSAHIEPTPTDDCRESTPALAFVLKGPRSTAHRRHKQL